MLQLSIRLTIWDHGPGKDDFEVIWTSTSLASAASVALSLKWAIGARAKRGRGRSTHRCQYRHGAMGLLDLGR
jgi:hypothetical protein